MSGSDLLARVLRAPRYRSWWAHTIQAMLSSIAHVYLYKVYRESIPRLHTVWIFCRKKLRLCSISLFVVWRSVATDCARRWELTSMLTSLNTCTSYSNRLSTRLFRTELLFCWITDTTPALRIQSFRAGHPLPSISLNCIVELLVYFQ